MMMIIIYHLNQLMMEGKIELIWNYLVLIIQQLIYNHSNLIFYFNDGFEEVRLG